MLTNFPKIGETVTNRKARRLCWYFDLAYLASRIEANPAQFKDWRFDGCSWLPDRFIGLFTGCNWRDITYKCCLPHDLGYAYGEPRNIVERKQVDSKFFNNLVTKAGMKKWMAYIFFISVRIGGIESFGSSFSWSFASRRK